MALDVAALLQRADQQLRSDTESLSGSLRAPHTSARADDGDDEDASEAEREQQVCVCAVQSKERAYVCVCVCIPPKNR